MPKTANPFQSKLVPYLSLIARLRQSKPPMSFQAIADYLREKHQITVAVSSLHNFVKVRMGRPERGIQIHPEQLPSSDDGTTGAFALKPIAPRPPLPPRRSFQRVFDYPED